MSAPPSPARVAERYIMFAVGLSGSPVKAAAAALGLSDRNFGFMRRRLELANPASSPAKWVEFRSAVFGINAPADWPTAMIWLANPQFAPPVSWQGLLAWIRDNPTWVEGPK